MPLRPVGTRPRPPPDETSTTNRGYVGPPSELGEDLVDAELSPERLCHRRLR
jgi:hypothetical protein